MKIARYMQGFCLALVTASMCWGETGWAQSTPGIGNPGQQEAPPSSAQLEDFERRIGPLKIRDQSFTIVLHMKRIKGVGEETVARMEIRDEAGKILYEKSFPYRVSENNFDETTEIGAQVLEGKQASGLLLTTDEEPSTPLGGGSYQVFGLFDGKLVPFSKPLSMEGDLIQASPPEKVVKTSAEPGLQDEVIRFRVWTSNVFVIVPVLVDWMQGKVRPAWRCTKMTPRGGRPICQFNVEAEPRPPQEDLGFVRFFAEADEGMGIAQHVVVKKNSKIEILQAEGELVWQEGDEQIGLSVSDDIWLKVRIDGKEGWIHTQEDFNAVGLPQAG